MSDESGGASWQSFADLAMGLMAVLILIVVILANQLRDEAQERETDLDQLQEFAELLLDALVRADAIQLSQNQAGEFMSRVFRETDCQLTYNADTGELQTGEGEGAAELYEPADTQLSERAREALASCREAFRTLAACMSAEAPCPYDDDPAAQMFRDDVEALVLQGNTDSSPYFRARYVYGAGGLRSTPKAFVDNAELGAERARQALGNLLALVQDEDSASDDMPDSALQVFMSRARIESPSFGQYQTGPLANRIGDCSATEVDCASARNLSLILRWRRQSLQRPFEEVRQQFCSRFSQPGHLRDSLSGERAERAHRLCREGGGAE